MRSSPRPPCRLAAFAPVVLLLACSPAQGPGRQLALNILHWLSGELD